MNKDMQEWIMIVHTLLIASLSGFGAFFFYILLGWQFSVLLLILVCNVLATAVGMLLYGAFTNVKKKK